MIIKNYNKLVRDKIPEIINSSGKNETAITRVLTDNEFIKELNVKLQEEVSEYMTDNSIEELADILEVIYALLLTKNKTFTELENIRMEKKNKRGGFDKKIFLINVKK